MRKAALFIILLAVLGVCGTASADSITSGVTVGSASVGTLYGGPCAVTGASLISDGTNDCQVWLLDSGVTKAGLKVDASVKPSEHICFSRPVYFGTNLQLLRVGTGAQIIVYYEQR